MWGNLQNVRTHTRNARARANHCEGKYKKFDFQNFVIRRLQNEDFLHFYSKKFGHIEKK